MQRIRRKDSEVHDFAGQRFRALAENRLNHITFPGALEIAIGAAPLGYLRGDIVQGGGRSGWRGRWSRRGRLWRQAGQTFFLRQCGYGGVVRCSRCGCREGIGGRLRVFVALNGVLQIGVVRQHVIGRIVQWGSQFCTARFFNGYSVSFDNFVVRFFFGAS